MQFSLAVSIQQQAQDACLLEGNSGVAQTCHTRRRVQQRAHGTMSSVFFQPVRVEMQRLRRR
jgi:hypothetical protein